MPDGQDSFRSARVADLFAGLQQFMMTPCMQACLSARLVQDVTGEPLHGLTVPSQVMGIQFRAHIFTVVCEKIGALPQPQQDILHAVKLVFGPLLFMHECMSATLMKAWLCTLVCHI